jgi:hypothetical protein
MNKSPRSDVSKVIDLNPDGLPVEPVTLEQIQRGLFEAVLGGMFVRPHPEPTRDDDTDG